MASKVDFDLVTGGAGFIGSHLVDRLVAQGRHVRVLDSFVVGRRANFDQHKGNPKVEVVEADVVVRHLAGVRAEQFLILPHEAVSRHMALKASQPERWLKGMRRLVREARARG